MSKQAGETRDQARSDRASLRGALRAYPLFTRALAPVVGAYLRSRAARGKEVPQRLAERTGRTAWPRPHGPLIWIHAASVGESLSVLPLIGRLLDADPSRHVLITTGTVTSAQLLEPRLPARAFHQFVPLDHPDFAARFLAHWRPDMALWVESELWPNLLQATAAAGVPAILVNARISDRSFKSWQRFPRAIEGLLRQFRLCLAPDSETADRLTALGADAVAVTGNLKHAARPLPADPEPLDALRADMADRPVWLAASVHDEDDLLIQAHRTAESVHPTLLTIVAPRQPDRGPGLAAKATQMGIPTARRANGENPKPETRIYVADTLGELGLFFRLADIAFLGRSLSAHGGSNPLEAARLDCAVLHGPHVENFAPIYAALDAAGGARTVRDGTELGETVSRLLSHTEERSAMIHAGAQASAAADGVLERVMTALAPYFPDRASDPMGEMARHAGA